MAELPVQEGQVPADVTPTLIQSPAEKLYDYVKTKVVNVNVLKQLIEKVSEGESAEEAPKGEEPNV